MKNLCIYYSGRDIPFEYGGFTIHQPVIADISMIGEYNYFVAVKTLCVDSSALKTEGVVEISNFSLMMNIINSEEGRENKKFLYQLLVLMFPNYMISIQKDKIILKEFLPNDQGTIEHEINEENFPYFVEIITDMFYVTNEELLGYNVKGKMAKEIAQNIKEGIEKRNSRKNNGEGKNIDEFGRKASILSVGLQISMRAIMESHTVFQLEVAYNVFSNKQCFETWEKQKLAGAKDIENVEYWDRPYFQ